MLLALALACSPAAAQSPYPSRPVQLVVPVPPGGAADFIARTVGAKLADALGASVVIKRNSCYQGYRFAPEDPPLALAAAAWRRLGREPAFRPTGGGSDASIFNARGIPTAVLTCGYIDAHAVTEHVSLADMRLAAEWVVAIAQEATRGD